MKKSRAIRSEAKHERYLAAYRKEYIVRAEETLPHLNSGARFGCGRRGH
ncbi:hypothetical protein GCM10007159_18290 [Modicisalibacter luteus]|nr:hypothetical protein GCM10007159_18290 [Halomonas lutea]